MKKSRKLVVRCEPELRIRLKRIAKKRRVPLADVVRGLCWKEVDADGAVAAGSVDGAGVTVGGASSVTPAPALVAAAA